MPFKRITRGKKKGKYRSPSGRTFTKKQVALYHANGGRFPNRRRGRRKKGRRKRRR